MATNIDFIEYLCDQISDTGLVRFRKMFGEYMVYVDDKPLFLVCDNTAFVKMLEPLTKLLADADTGFPYNGAKKHYIVDVDNRELMKQIVEILLPITALPKPKKRQVV